MVVTRSRVVKREAIEAIKGRGRGGAKEERRGDVMASEVMASEVIRVEMRWRIGEVACT